MFRTLFRVAGVAALAPVASAFASSCVQPIPPAGINGATVTKQELEDAIADFKGFQSASDDYQSCLVAEYKQKQLDAAKEKDPKPLDPSVAQELQARGEANQRLKEKIGGELNAAIHIYKSKHPGK